MSKKAIVSSVDRVTIAKNKVRGLLSRGRDSSFGRTKASNTQRFRAGLKQCLLSARADLHSDDYQDFLGWYGSLLKPLLMQSISRKAEFSYLAGFAKNAPRISLQRELRWVAKYIGLHSEIISEFVSSVIRIDRGVLDGDLTGAQKEIDALDDKYGYSFWSTQLSIALAQDHGDLEEQKKRVAFLREQHQRGVLSFVSYFTGVRNEGRVSWTHFKEIIEVRLGEASYDSDLKTYLHAKLLCDYPQDDRGLATVLRHELSNHPFDIYASLIAILQVIATDPSLKHNREAAEYAITELSDISDFRLDRLRKLICPAESSTSESSVGALETLDALCAEQETGKRCASNTFGGGQSAMSVLANSVELAVHRSAVPLEAKDRSRLEHLLASVLSRKSSALNDLEEWQKICRNYAGLPTFDGLRAVEDALGLTRAAPKMHAWKLMSLNAVEIGADAQIISHQAPSRGGSTPSECFLAQVFRDDLHASSFTEGLNAVAKSIAECLRLYRLREFDVLASKVDLIDAVDSFYSRFLAPFFIEALSRTGRKDQLVAFLAAQIASQSASFSLLPASEITASFSKQDWKALRGSIAPLIVIHAAWRVTNSDKIATTLRHELSAFLRFRKLSKPSQLADEVEDFDLNEIVYFLRRVCRPPFMDLVRTFETSKQVLEERRVICGVLNDLDPEHVEEYTVEVVGISSQLRIDRGLEAVDSSRLHVDEDAFRRWAHKNVREDFERYTALVHAGLSAQSDIEVLLKTLLDELASRQAFYTPDDQSDAILIDVFKQLRLQFLTNSDFGLDYFLSKRVRHQSFIGLIRDPLEYQNLITMRESEFGEYRENTFWKNKLQLSVEENEAVQKIFAEFATVFDERLIELKDTFLQVRTDEKPDGAFVIPITTRSVFLTRTLTQQGIDFDTFLSSTIQVFWRSLMPCLSHARERIGVELKRDLSDLLSDLREDLRRVVEGSVFYPELSTAITDTSVEMQRRLDQAAGWFIRPDNQTKNDLYTLEEAVDIAITSALTMHRAVELQIDVAVEGGLKLQLPDLLLLWETIFVGIDNVKSHSGIKAGAKVQLKCELQPENLLIIRIESELARGEIAPDAAEQLYEIKQKIADGDLGQSSKTEGGSGFIKLASALNHTPRGKIEFGKTEQDTFELVVSFRPTTVTAVVIGVGDENTDR